MAAQLPGLPPLSANFQMYENANIPSDLAASIQIYIIRETVFPTVSLNLGWGLLEEEEEDETKSIRYRYRKEHFDEKGKLRYKLISFFFFFPIHRVFA